MEKGIEIYKVEEGEIVFDIDRDKETIWATQEEMAKIFDVASFTKPELSLRAFFSSQLRLGFLSCSALICSIDRKL